MSIFIFYFLFKFWFKHYLSINYSYLFLQILISHQTYRQIPKNYYINLNFCLQQILISLPASKNSTLILIILVYKFISKYLIFIFIFHIFALYSLQKKKNSFFNFKTVPIFIYSQQYGNLNPNLNYFANIIIEYYLKPIYLDYSYLNC